MSFKILTFVEALKQPVDAVVAVAVKVLETGEYTTYTNRDDAQRKYNTVRVADSTASIWMRNYNS